MSWLLSLVDAGGIPARPLALLEDPPVFRAAPRPDLPL